jgi:adenylate cyclase
MSMLKKRYKEKRLVSLSILIGTIVLALLIGYLPTIIDIERNLIDYRFKLRGTLDLSESPIVIVAIDDQSDESTKERWPWPRDYYAHLIKNLNQAGAAVIGIDVIFGQADIHGGPSDSAFAEALRIYDNVVLAGKIEKRTLSYGHEDYVSLVEPYEQFVETGTNWGLASIEGDPDGILRRYPAGQVYNDSIYPSFVVEILKKYKDYPKQTAITTDANNFYIGDYILPKFESEAILINFSGPSNTFQYYSFDSIVDDLEFDGLLDEYALGSFIDEADEELNMPPGLLYSGGLKDKIVLVGATMKELHDFFNTPFEMTPGVEVHANALQTILTQEYLQGISIGFYYLILVVLAVLVWLFTRYLPTFGGSLVTAVLSAVYVVIIFWLFINFNLVIEIAIPVLVIAFSYTGHTMYHYILSQHEKKMIQGAFMHYVPEQVVKELISHPEKLALGGEERIVTIMFTDVAGFTSISEKLSPADLVHLLNEYLTEMTDIVLSHEGVIDKYEGDAIMAEFGVPVPFEEHAIRACEAAIKMQKRLKEMRAKWKEENKPQLRARIGINTGEVIVGNMGSRDVFDYTVMGDHVNLGSRLEGANKFYGTYIMISEFTQEMVRDDFLTRELDLIRVKGKEKPIKVYELIADRGETLDPDFIKMLDHYKKGIEYYRGQAWNEAIDCFELCVQLQPEDAPSNEYRKRCINYKFNSPGEEWDGVTVMTEK